MRTKKEAKEMISLWESLIDVNHFICLTCMGGLLIGLHNQSEARKDHLA